MANFDLYFPKEVKLEGSAYENDPNDSGGCTKYGITLDDLTEANADLDHDGEFTCNDVKSMQDADSRVILKKIYWDFFKADSIDNQSVAEYIVDSGLNMGRILIAKWVQGIVGVDADGHPGKMTVQAINAHFDADEFNKLYEERIERYTNIVNKRPSQSAFMKGWVNRANAIKYSDQA